MSYHSLRGLTGETAYSVTAKEKKALVYNSIIVSQQHFRQMH